jgi:hypothetical protein
MVSRNEIFPEIPSDPGRLDGEIFGSSERAPEQRVALSVDGDRSTPGGPRGPKGLEPFYLFFS